MKFNNANGNNQTNLPKVTFALLSYNQEAYVREAVEAALSQDYQNLEIVISDDCSMDNTYDVICDAVAGSSVHHQVILNKNETNLGIGGNLNRIMELSSGDFIVVAAGDDISVAHRVTAMIEHWMKLDCKCKSIFSGVELIDQDGAVLQERLRKYDGNPYEVIKNELMIEGASHGWDRAIFDFFGPLRDDLIAEDMVLPMRSMLLGGVERVDACLVKYRQCESEWKKVGRGKSDARDAVMQARHKGGLSKYTAFSQMIEDVGLCIQERGGGEGLSNCLLYTSDAADE